MEALGLHFGQPYMQEVIAVTEDCVSLMDVKGS